MNTQIALFRGINVGGKNLVPMAELKPLIEDLGLQNVQTYIQSGNVLFQSSQTEQDDLAEKISSAVETQFGFKPEVMLVTPDDLQAAVDKSPFKNTEPKSQHFYFLSGTPTAPDFDTLDTLKSENESFELDEKIFYLFAPDGIGRSKLAAHIEKSLGVSVTARNRNSVTKMLAML
ncbi:DUF1697 domain-containing protein [Corallincola spongiicola]|uniref:DUF1697 domain-containing protein n=1 Tax=Corallincola spongiicola TaxID=2520508 RepID=A0ABY1WMX1_9GAMM|nr:DUF1697 domain-containing protein [Corallincola spongiicola]TAA43652.1 DUF1697 domain-containing protein [Corallincola spongiicola]